MAISDERDVSGTITQNSSSFGLPVLPNKHAYVQVVSPPNNADVILSGWHSILAAKWISWLSVSGFPSKWFTPTSPATIQTELMPSPFSLGFFWVSHIQSRKFHIAFKRTIQLNFFSSRGTSIPSSNTIVVFSDKSKKTSLYNRKDHAKGVKVGSQIGASSGNG